MARFAVLALTLVLAGCAEKAEPAATPRPAADEAVVRGWADDLRRGDVDAAAARFALPATVANGTPEIELETRAEVRSFNRALPCGGRVTDILRHHGYLIATFELTERPGGDCGSGMGNTAQAAFQVRDGKITRWLRVDDGEQAPVGPTV